jgi:hypothetical protein
MAADVQLRMLAPQMREAAGRFRRANPGSALDKMILAWARQAVAELREATPVEEGEPLGREHPPPGTARARWRFDDVPGQKMVRISNDTEYLKFFLTGTGQDTGGWIYPENLPGFLMYYAKEGPYAGRKIWRRRVRGIQPYPPLVAAVERLGKVVEVMTHDLGIEIMKEIAEVDGGA